MAIQHQGHKLGSGFLTPRGPNMRVKPSPLHTASPASVCWVLPSHRPHCKGCS